MPELSYREAVRDALATAMRQDDDVFVMGEDIAEMGGSMGVTHGMLEEFGAERVRNTPISEMALAGAAIGAALQGMRPVAEIMYEDFMTLAAEQVVNQAAKHRYMSGGQLTVPVVFRTQGGAGWSPGAQHAQQLEAWFVHIPGLKVVFASTPEDVRGLLWSSIYDDNPVVFFEHRTLYGIKGNVPEKIEPIPLGKARVHREGEDVTVIATGRLVHESLKAAEEAEKEGVSVEVVDPRTLQPLDEETLVASVKKTNRAVVAHEAVTRMGFGAEVASVLQYQAFDWLDAPIERVGAQVRAAAIRAGDGVVRHPARRERARGDLPHRQQAELMATEVKLPRLGQGMESGTIVKWLKSEGEPVEKGEALYELDTDKVTQEVEAEASGVLLKIAIPEGEVEVGRTIGFIGEQGEEVASSDGDARVEASKEAPDSGEKPAVAPKRDPERDRGREASTNGAHAEPAPASTSGGRIKASPLARRIARERGIELSQLRGTGPDGRIVAEDVERAQAQPAAAAPVAAAAPSGEIESRPLSNVRKTIARRLTQAWTVPAFQLTVDVDMTRANALVKAQRELNPDVRITVTDILTKLSAQALMRHRDMNVQYSEDALLVFPSADVGIAVAAPQGLVVPVVRNADRQSIAQIAQVRGDLVSRARDNKLRTDDLEGGTFTISNLGMYDIDQFIAVLNPPQASILAVGSTREQVVPRDGELLVVPVMTMTLTCDHRAVDGATGAEFLKTLKAFLQDPGLAL